MQNWHMMKTSVERWWELIGGIVRLAERDGAWPSSRELGKLIRLSRRETLRYLSAMKEDGLVAVLGGQGSNEAGWIPTQDGAAWRGVSIPVLSVDVAPRKIRRDPYRLRKWRALERLKTRRAVAECLDAVESESGFEA